MKQKATMELFDLTEQLAYLVKQVDLTEAYVSEIQPRITDKKLMKKLNLAGFTEELTTLKKALRVSSSDRYVAAEEPKLREKISELYSTIASYDGRPTNAQLDNVKLLTDNFEEAKSKFDTLKNNLSIIGKLAQKIEGITPFNLPTWEEFKAAP